MRICTVNKSGFANYYKKSFFFISLAPELGSVKYLLKKFTYYSLMPGFKGRVL